MMSVSTDKPSALDVEEIMVEDAACTVCLGAGGGFVLRYGEHVDCTHCNGTGREPSKPTA